MYLLLWDYFLKFADAESTPFPYNSQYPESI